MKKLDVQLLLLHCRTNSLKTFARFLDAAAERKVLCVNVSFHVIIAYFWNKLLINLP